MDRLVFGRQDMRGSSVKHSSALPKTLRIKSSSSELSTSQSI